MHTQEELIQMGGILAEPIVVTGDLVLGSITITTGVVQHQTPAVVLQAALQVIALILMTKIAPILQRMMI